MEVYKLLKPNPRNEHNLFYKVIFLWLFPLFRKGWNETLEKEDLFQAQGQDGSATLGDLLSRKWTEEVERRSPSKRSYKRALWKTFGNSFLFTGIFVLVSECFLKISGPIFLGWLIRCFNNTPGYDGTWGYISAVGIVVSNVATVFLHQGYFFCNQCIGMKIRIASCSLIYRKALRLSTQALDNTTVGQLVNLLSNDVSRFDLSITLLPYLLIGPLQTLISTAILWTEIGPSCLGGIVLLFLYVPFQSYMGKVFSKLRMVTAFRTDERVRIMNEMICAMRVIKMYAWETPFKKIVEEARRKEIGVIMKSNYFRAINMTLFYTSAKIVIFMALLSYVLTGNVLTADKVFLTSALLNNIQLSMTLFFPVAISIGSESLTSCKRIQTFLEMEEKDENFNENKTMDEEKTKDCYLKLDNIGARWTPEAKADSLSKISFEVRSGEVLALIGSVGSGKSSLLNAILGELPLTGGVLGMTGKLAYVSQEPWIFPGTVRENILFGQEYNLKRYKGIIKACSLERDFQLFTSGDLTTVGERGISLSGGQKARISLARALYFDGDIYLLDDPLSAVDTNVGKHIFEECVLGLLKGKVTILATHQLQLLNRVDKVLFLQDGAMKAFGSYQDLLEEGVDFSQITAEDGEEDPPSHLQSEEEPQFLSGEIKLKKATEVWNMIHGSTGDIHNRLTGSKSMISSPQIAGSVLSLHEESLYGDKDNEDCHEQKDEMTSESKAKGSVSYTVYFRYFLSGGGVLLLVVFMLANIYFEMLHTGSAYFLSYWTNNEELYGESKNATVEKKSPDGRDTLKPNITFTEEDRYNCAYIYSGITGLLLVFSLIRTVLFYRICMTASRNLHNRMFSRVIRTPMRFFEIHPIGQILNRFTKDTGQVDDLLPPSLYDFITIMFSFSGIIGMVLSLNIWILFPTGFLGIIFIVMRWIYISSGRDVKRIEGITRSPVFSHLSSTLQGLPTIRAFGAQQAAIGHFDNQQDFHTSAFYTFLSMTRIFGAVIDLLSSVFIAMVTASFMLQPEALGGDVGLGISIAMMLSGMFQWGAKQSAEVENHMTSVERMLEYSQLELEASPNGFQAPKKEGWPHRGGITFRNVYLYYDEHEPPVLKGIDFTVAPEEKIGIVGRTGAGKSSLLSCLFRLTPPTGDIFIDGVNTKNILLDDLRRSISIIPQDPTLFTGSVRYNLDPFGEYSDDKVWTALEEVQMKDTVKEMTNQLESHVTEGGGNLSVGQRQLVCLARAILKHNKILVLDEATANIDPKTDSCIQETIKEKFRDCTVLTIAHRLHTIMDSDRVLVLDSGTMEEFGPPYELLSDGRSKLSHLVDQTGVGTAAHLRKIAEEKYKKRT